MVVRDYTKRPLTHGEIADYQLGHRGMLPRRKTDAEIDREIARAKAVVDRDVALARAIGWVGSDGR